jgi:hypothetical protein
VTPVPGRQARDDNPDRSKYYQDAAPGKLLDQLNECWRQLRLFKEAVADRDRNLDRNLQAIEEQRKLIKSLRQALKLTNRLWPLIYALSGAILGKLAELGMEWIFRSR